METTPQPTRPTWEHRLHAVLALLGGEPLPQVVARFGIGRSVSYKWRHRALTALHMQRAQTPPPPPPQWRFYARHHPHSLWHGDCLEKVFDQATGRQLYQLTLLDDYSRGYVFCDLFDAIDPRTTIAAMCHAMRQWQVIPKAVVFDNGLAFRGKLVEAFCRNLGTQLLHTAPQHPQTNGKLERAFWDDMPEFYESTKTWGLRCPGLFLFYGEVGVAALEYCPRLPVQRLDPRLEQQVGALA